MPLKMPPPPPPTDFDDSPKSVAKFAMLGLSVLAIGLASALSMEGAGQVAQRSNAPAQAAAVAQFERPEGEVIAIVESGVSDTDAQLAAPPALVARQVGETVELSWSDAGEHETSYHLGRSDSETGDIIYLTLPSNTESFIDVGLLFGVGYEYWLSACTDTGCSDPAEASITVR